MLSKTLRRGWFTLIRAYKRSTVSPGETNGQQRLYPFSRKRRSGFQSRKQAYPAGS
jgi:hypothetical protein